MKGAAIAVIGFVLLIPIILIMMLGGGGGNACPDTSIDPTVPQPAVDMASVPLGPIHLYSGVQLVNAAHIINAAKAMSLPVEAQVIGVMTAMGESSLQVLDVGDAVGPDSRGLFQQRDNGAWGTYEDRMNPTISATNFFKGLQAVDAWQTLTPSLAAHRVQRNADPNHYTDYLVAATDVVEALAGVQLPPVAVGGTSAADTTPAGSPECPAPVPVDAGTFSSEYVEPGPWGGHSNGKIDDSQMSPIPWASDHVLRADATLQLTKLNNAYMIEFGRNMSITDAYRSYDAQVRLKAQKGGWAATPGKSNHGWGLAVDLGDGVNNYGTPTYLWMKQNAPLYGWYHPLWAEPTGVGPHEPWHWEYWGGIDAQV